LTATCGHSYALGTSCLLDGFEVVEPGCLSLAAMAADELSPAYLLFGSDRPKIGRALARLRARFGSEGVEGLAAESVSGADAVASLNALGLFGSGRLVIVEGVQSWKKPDAEAIRGYLGQPAPGAVLALVADEIPRDAALADVVGKAGKVLRYDIPKPKDPSVWVRTELARLGVQATEDSARRLVEIVGDDVGVLALEIDKLATWAGGEVVGPREVELLAVAAGGESPGWLLSDAWGNRDVAGVLAACEAELDEGVEPFLIAVRLAAQVGLVRTVQALASEGLGSREIAGRLKKHEFRVRKALGHAERHSSEDLDLAIVRLAELDAALKGASRLSAELELERVLIEVTRPLEAASPSR
jgi:DNA polymerase-3 subunit delta